MRILQKLSTWFVYGPKVEEGPILCDKSVGSDNWPSGIKCQNTERVAFKFAIFHKTLDRFQSKKISPSMHASSF